MCRNCCYSWLLGETMQHTWKHARDGATHLAFQCDHVDSAQSLKPTTPYNTLHNFNPTTMAANGQFLCPRSTSLQRISVCSCNMTSNAVHIWRSIFDVAQKMKRGSAWGPVLVAVLSEPCAIGDITPRFIVTALKLLLSCPCFSTMDVDRCVFERSDAWVVREGGGWDARFASVANAGLRGRDVHPAVCVAQRRIPHRVGARWTRCPVWSSVCGPSYFNSPPIWTGDSGPWVIAQGVRCSCTDQMMMAVYMLQSVGWLVCAERGVWDQEWWLKILCSDTLLWQDLQVEITCCKKQSCAAVEVVLTQS